MRNWFGLFIGAIGIFGIAIPLGLLRRWDVPLGFSALSAGGPELLKFIWNCAAAALIPALLSCVVMALIFRRLKRPTRKAIVITAVASLAIGLLGGALPLWKLDRRQELMRRECEAQNGLDAKLQALKTHGRYDEMVQEMERVLAIHEECIAEMGPWPRDCNHGFSYIFVYLHPASEDLPGQLGTGLSWSLYDAWHDPSYPKKLVADDLSKAMTRSKHPLLRALGFWVEQDYPAFEREAFASAAAGDRRMDTLALVAACAISKDPKAALEKVRPILDRGVGIGKTPGYNFSSSAIRAYLEGTGPPPTAAFMRPRAP